MKDSAKILTSSAVLLLAAGSAAAQPIMISCEGTKCGGGGGRLYQYEVLNVSGGAITLTGLLVGTDDLNPANYSNWLNPAPCFVPAVGAGGPAWTTGVQTPHGINAPGPLRLSAGAVSWNCPAGFNLANNASAIFGFDNNNASLDMEWFVASAPIAGSTNWGAPVPGPLGVFNVGPVHGPVPEPATLTLLALGGLALLRRRSLRV